MLHPVGPLPAAVYWRRRVLVLTLLLSLVGGGGWLAVSLVTGGTDDRTTAAPTGAATSIAAPALEQVVPSLASVRIPTPTASSSAPAQPPAAPAPSPGGPCTDDMLGLAIRAPAGAPAASAQTFELVVANTSPVPCVRALDAQLQELVLLDAAGGRVWGSNDCFPETSAGLRTLAPGEVVSFPVEWSGLTSEPTCTAARVPPPPGGYTVRGRLDTKVSTDAPFTIVP